MGLFEFNWLNTIDLPITEPAGIVVDRDGFIYVGSSGFSRIGKYTASGNFLYSWYVDALGGPFSMRLAKDDFLEACPAKRHIDQWSTALQRYDLGGRRVFFKEFVQCEYHKFGGSLELHDGDRFYTDNEFFYPSVMRVTAEGSRTPVIKPSIYFLTLMHPLVWFVLIVLSASFGALLKRSKG